MKPAIDMLGIVDALGLPADARIDARVPKKILAEQGAPTAADKRAIQDGIDELQWLGVCKPTTIGVPAYADDIRQYLEIAILACAFRPAAKAARLIELIHRAVPYPVVLVTKDNAAICLSVADKRAAQNEADKVVVERVVVAEVLGPLCATAEMQPFLDSLALAKQPLGNLYTLYAGWSARLEAWNAAQLSGAYAPTDDFSTVERRRSALDTHAILSKEVIGLRARARREKQMHRRVDLNLQIQRLEGDLEANKKNL
jgi:hypothetical protein